MMSALLALVIGALTLCFFLLRRYLAQRVLYFKQRNIPGPPVASLLFGNAFSFRSKIIHEVLQEWTHKYGKVYGYFEGGSPILIISDLDLVQEVLIKKFSNFAARKKFPVEQSEEKPHRQSLFTSRGAGWKRLRSIVNPTFSAAKMRNMAELMDECVDVLNGVFATHAQQGEAVEVYELYQRLTMDVIGRTAFGFVSDCQRNPDDKFLILCRAVMLKAGTMPVLAIFNVMFPELRRYGSKLIAATEFMRGHNPYIQLREFVKTAIEQWRQTPMDSSSLLSLLFQAELPAEASKTGIGSDSVALHSVTANGLQVEKKLFFEEVLETSILFLLAGYETTSTALTYVSYLLAQNPAVQQRLQDEVDSQTSLDVESLQKMQYMDMVIKETLRLYPVATLVEARECVNPCTIGKYDIPLGLTVQVDVWSIHYDPAIYPDPHVFDPERFHPTTEIHRHPMAWLPFGAGPRNCIGMRFALQEMRLCLAKIMKDYSFRTCAATQIPLQLKEGISTSPKDGVNLVIEKRKKE